MGRVVQACRSSGACLWEKPMERVFSPAVCWGWEQGTFLQFHECSCAQDSRVQASFEQTACQQHTYSPHPPNSPPTHTTYSMLNSTLQWLKSGQLYIQNCIKYRHLKQWENVNKEERKKKQKFAYFWLSYIIEMRGQNTLPLSLNIREFRNGGQARINSGKLLQDYKLTETVWTNLFKNSWINQSLVLDHKQWIWKILSTAETKSFYS